MGDKTEGKFVNSLPQIVAVSIKNIVTLGFGMALGFPTILIPTLKGGDPNESLVLTPEQISWIGSIFFITVPFGSLCSGIVTQTLGRKLAMQIINTPFVIAWLLFYYSDRVEYLFVALILMGLGGGLFEAPFSTYLAEITQPHLRGILSACSSLTGVFGAFTQFLFGLFFTWRTVALINLTIPILAILLLFIIPESPHWLIYKGRIKQAQESLAWLRGWTTIENVELEFQELRENITKQIPQSSDIRSAIKRFCSKRFVRPYFLLNLVFTLYHFTGMTTLITYGVQIFDALHAPIGNYYAMFLLGVAEISGGLICVITVRYVGKRPLTLTSTIGSGLCYLTIGIYAYVNDMKYFTPGINEHHDTNAQWLPTTLLICSAFISEFSLQILPWVLIGEIYPFDIRAMGSSFSACTAYIIGFIASKTYLSTVETLTLPGTFWFYCSVCFTGGILIYFFLPETEGRTLYEIEMHFDGTQRIKRNAGVLKRQKNNISDTEFNGHINQGFS